MNPKMKILRQITLSVSAYNVLGEGMTNKLTFMGLSVYRKPDGHWDYYRTGHTAFVSGLIINIMCAMRMEEDYQGWSRELKMGILAALIHATRVNRPTKSRLP